MGARGEATISVKGREVNVLFTNRAIMSVEQQLGKGIVELLQKFQSGGFGYTDMTALLRAGMEAARLDARSGGKPVSNNDAVEIIHECGLIPISGPLIEAVTAVITYGADGDEESGDEDPNG